MFWTAHIAAGLAVGNLTGNYWLAIAASLAPDIDHLPMLLRDWRAAFRREDPLGMRKGVLHNLWAWCAVTLLIVSADARTGFVVSVCYLAHLAMDALDGSDFYPAVIGANVRGPIGYLSKSEFLITALLLLFLVRGA